MGRSLGRRLGSLLALPFRDFPFVSKLLAVWGDAACMPLNKKKCVIVVLCLIDFSALALRLRCHVPLAT
eukprot:3558721-Alexandrium_andersonii.AAC.1